MASEPVRHVALLGGGAPNQPRAIAVLSSASNRGERDLGISVAPLGSCSVPVRGLFRRSRPCCNNDLLSR